MNTDHPNTPIIKPNPYIWFYYGLAIIAGGAFVLMVILTISDAVPNKPGWAPDGCTVRRIQGTVPALAIIISDIENFDSESEVASVIIGANDAAGFFLRSGGNTQNMGRYNIIDLQYPDGPDGIPILRYYRQLQGQSAVTMLEMYIDDEMTFEQEITNTDLERIQNGELVLNFLQFELDGD